jgi:hypothetical protein
VLLLLPVTAAAQQRWGSDQRRSEQQGSDDRRSDQRRSERHDSSVNDHRPSTGLSPIGLPPASAPRTPSWEQKQTPWWERQAPPAWERPDASRWQQPNQVRTAPNDDRDRRWRDDDNSGTHRQNRRSDPPTVIIVPRYGYFPYTFPGTNQFVVTPPPPNEIVVQRPVEPPSVPTGVLRLEVEPKELLQVFVDGVYIGTPADLGDEIALTPGTRRIELRARGFKTLAFSAEIVQNRSITYRATLEREDSAPAPPPPVIVMPAAVPGSKTIYVIPGCYLGNVAPTPATLRPGCDISTLSKIEP